MPSAVTIKTRQPARSQRRQTAPPSPQTSSFLLPVPGKGGNSSSQSSMEIPQRCARMHILEVSSAPIKLTIKSSRVILCDNKKGYLTENNWRDISRVLIALHGTNGEDPASRGTRGWGRVKSVILTSFLMLR